MVYVLPVGSRFYAGPRRVLNRQVRSDRHFLFIREAPGDF